MIPNINNVFILYFILGIKKRYRLEQLGKYVRDFHSNCVYLHVLTPFDSPPLALLQKFNLRITQSTRFVNEGKLYLVINKNNIDDCNICNIHNQLNIIDIINAKNVLTDELINYILDSLKI